MKFLHCISSAVLSLLASEEPSRWSRRTLKRRTRTEWILSQIVPKLRDDDMNSQSIFVPGKGNGLDVPILNAPAIDWESLDPIFDPQQGGKIRADTSRARRKRVQVEAFAYVLSHQLLMNSSTTEPTTIVDAGSGAGNLCIPLAGVLNEIEICAMDVNPIALDRLSERVRGIPSLPRITTTCTDLASAILPSNSNSSVVVSLHACGAATDLAIRLATRHRIPFIVSPCCTAKSVVRRAPNRYGPSASVERSAAPADMTYPRSEWLRFLLEQLSLVEENRSGMTPEDYYELLAKTADVGLGPQTPLEQYRHQRMAKLIVEYDRLKHANEAHEYQVRLLRLGHEENYGKSELLLGAPRDSEAARVLSRL